MKLYLISQFENCATFIQKFIQLLCVVTDYSLDCLTKHFFSIYQMALLALLPLKMSHILLLEILLLEVSMSIRE